MTANEKLLTAAATAIIVSAMLPLVMILTSLFGYFGGWLFETLFSDTWATMKVWLCMPQFMTGGMLGAFLAAFGGCFGKAVSSGK